MVARNDGHQRLGPANAFEYAVRLGLGKAGGFGRIRLACRQRALVSTWCARDASRSGRHATASKRLCARSPELSVGLAIPERSPPLWNADRHESGGFLFLVSARLGTERTARRALLDNCPLSGVLDSGIQQHAGHVVARCLPGRRAPEHVQGAVAAAGAGILVLLGTDPHPPLCLGYVLPLDVEHRWVRRPAGSHRL